MGRDRSLPLPLLVTRLAAGVLHLPSHSRGDILQCTSIFHEITLCLWFSDGSVVSFQKIAVAVLASVVVFLKTAVAVLMRLC